MTIKPRVKEVSDTVDQYAGEFLSLLNNDYSNQVETVKKLRQSAMNRFTELGFPTTKLEEWKNTNVDSIAKTYYNRPTAKDFDIDRKVIESHYIDGCHRIVFINGNFIPEYSSPADNLHAIEIKELKNINEKELFEFLKDYCQKFKEKIDSSKEKTLLESIIFLKNKAKTLGDIYKNAQYILNDAIKISSEDLKLLDVSSKKILKDFLSEYEKMTKISKESLEKIINGLIDKHKTNFKGIGQPLRIALTGSKYGPGLYDIILSLNKNEIINKEGFGEKSYLNLVNSINLKKKISLEKFIYSLGIPQVGQRTSNLFSKHFKNSSISMEETLNRYFSK